MKKIISKTVSAFWGVLLVASLSSIIKAQQPAQASALDRDRGKVMLRIIKDDLKKNYYDPELRGIDIEARFKTASEKIDKATSLGHIMGIIAQAVTEFDDSHTRFIPPGRVNKTEYGWRMQAIGDKCFVTAIKPGSDAEAKGPKIGDEVLMIDSFVPARENLWKINYYYYSLRPQPGMKLVVRRPNGKQEEIPVAAKISSGKRIYDLTTSDIFDVIRKSEAEDYLNRQRYRSFGKDLLVWKMPGFDLSESEVDEIMGKVKDHKALVLDLRGNGGGYVRTLNRLVANFFDRDIKIADLKGRKKYDPQIAKTRGEEVFRGDLVVLIDSESGSAAEVFARVVQLEKRGTVIGDRSAGAVMMSRFYTHEMGAEVVTYFGTNITAADLVMADGKSLEKIGVIPDETVLPTADELAARKDKALSRAPEILGVKMEPAEAGKMFPVEWAK